MRRHNAQMQTLLNTGQIFMHPAVVAELALGSLHDRKNTLAELDKILHVRTAPLHDVRQMIEARVLYASGIGLTDAHLIASCLITPGVTLWTRDTRLRVVSQALGIDAGLP